MIQKLPSTTSTTASTPAEDDLTDPEVPKDKRGPGRPKDSGEYPVTMNLRLTADQGERLAGLAATANCRRSQVLRHLIQTGHVAKQTQAEGVAFYRQTANLDSGLRHLRALPGLSAEAQRQVDGLLTQVGQLLATLNQPAR